MPSRRSLSHWRPVLAGTAALLLLAACGPTTDAPSAVSSGSGQATGEEAGGTVQTEKPAVSDAIPLSDPPSELHVNRTDSFYDVTGSSTRAILRDLQRRGPRIGSQRHFGRTAWTAHWEIEFARPVHSDGSDVSGRRCRLLRADVYVDVDVTLPRWETPPGASAPLQREWKSFVDALAFHEREHRESVVSAGRRVVRALEGLEASSCERLKRDANGKASDIIEEARAYNRRYDERTGHGRTQGARWPQ